ncbi:unnamed protein product [Closterium sp. NIES-64]|nr:unnamed protein product [Closterium sp. NIES-64]CAI5988781.1 unnamed protein product [Closterium sp. NIES-65]
MRACSSGAAASTLASPASFETSRNSSAAASPGAGPPGAAACREAVTSELLRRFGWADREVVEGVLAAVGGERAAAEAILADMGGEGAMGGMGGNGGEGAMGGTCERVAGAGVGGEADRRAGEMEEEGGKPREADGHDDVDGDCDDVDVFRTFRAEALAASRAHARLAGQAARAYDRGDHAAARQLSHASREEKERAESLHTEAAGKILAHRNRGRSLWELDLHGLLPGEAVSALEGRLRQLEGQAGVSVQENAAAREASVEEQTGRSSIGAAEEQVTAEEQVWRSSGVVLPAKVLSSARPELMVITGVGRHSSGGQPNLPMAVKRFLHEASPRHTTCAVAASPAVADNPPSLLDLVPEIKIEKLDISFPAYNPEDTAGTLDLIVVGAGPAGLSVAQQVASHGMKVCCVDPAPESMWPNNYGVWVDEFEALDLTDCLDYVWQKAVVYLDDGKQKYLDRPYGRVSRRALKMKMASQCIKNGVTFHTAKVDSVEHTADNSVVRCSDGTEIRAALVLDATGFSRRLVQYSQPYNPGYQAAWGIVAEVDSHPFALDQMVFMDWRDSHLAPGTPMQKSNADLPTFLYAMPLSPTTVFLEETSLVARPAVAFDEIQRRLEKRLAHLGIKVNAITEQEYCLIPMGGVLPDMPQRVLGIGGTAGMVHPSTGYMVARTLAAAPVVAAAIVKQLEREGREQGERRGGDSLSASVWEDVWPLWRKEQREFFCFGMDVLLRLDLAGNRRFFDAFFDLTPYQWHGFLSSRLNIMELISFGLSLFKHASNPARIEIMAKGLPGLGTLIQNVVKMRL